MINAAVPRFKARIITVASGLRRKGDVPRDRWRLKSGFGSVPATFRHELSIQEEIWTGDHLQFRVSALGQVASGTIDVADDHVRLTVALPWLLAQLAEKMQPLIRNQGQLMLDKK